MESLAISTSSNWIIGKVDSTTSQADIPCHRISLQNQQARYTKACRIKELQRIYQKQITIEEQSKNQDLEASKFPSADRLAMFSWEGMINTAAKPH
jgi:hypothetical protein